MSVREIMEAANISVSIDEEQEMFVLAGKVSKYMKVTTRNALV